MEQELMDFDKWLELQHSTEVEYFAVYNSDGVITSVGPGHAILSETKIKIDDDIALNILEGRENVFSYRVDIPTKTLVKLNSFSMHTLTKIDDVLHRVVDRKWSKITDPDISITHDSNKSQLKFSMNEKYKKLIWEGETEMNFLITDYNDPNILLQMITFKVGDIAGGDKIFTVDIRSKFSVYTRRIFDQYVINTL
jgi:hypothetical protein